MTRNKMIVRDTDNLIHTSTWMLGRERSLECRSVMSMESAVDHANWWMEWINQGHAKVTIQTDTLTEIERQDGMVVRFTPATEEDIIHTAERGNYGPGALTLDYLR